MAVNRVTTTALYNNASVVQNVFHFLNPDGFLSNQQICLEIRDNWIAIVKNLAAASCVWTNIRSERIDQVVNPAAANLAVNIAGTGNSNTPHVCLAFIIRLQTAIAGRHGRGRIYFGAPRPDWIGSSLVLAAGITFINGTTIPALMARYGPTGNSGLTLGVHRKDDRQSLIQISGMSLATTLGIQRRRNIGVGV